MRSFNKIFGIGMPRTGTHSLVAALNMLGIQSLHYNDEIGRHFRLANYKPEKLGKVRGIANTCEHSYPQLDKAWPNSLFILTERSSMDAWLKSCKTMWPSVKSSDLHFIEIFGSTQFNEDRWRYVYETHNRNAREYFEKRQCDLLIVDWGKGDGWKELCGILEIDECPPFPHEGRQEY